MSPTIAEQIEHLKSTISDMESQREELGDAIVQQAVEPLRKKLVELTRLLETSQTKRTEAPQQQRKLLTLLFMDIVGSTAMIQHMDPEDVSEIIDHNLKRLARPIEEHGGRVTSFTGDGYMAVFGAPTAREDDPERAVRAGLGVLRQAELIAEELEKEREILDFKVRVGINTGLVLLGGETEGEDTTKGPAVHLAARLQSAAPPGGMLISHDTYRHVRGVFDVRPWEPIKVKGFDDPVQAYQVLSAKPRAFRSYTRGVEGVETPMVGRHDELKYLQDALFSAIEDHEGQVITILGEAGVGKSRLLYEFQNWIDLQPQSALFFEGRAHLEAQGMPLAMLRDLFEFRFQLQESDTLQVVREKVRLGFQDIFGAGDEAEMKTHILGQWLGFDFSFSQHLRGVLNDAEQLRNRGLMYLGEYFKRLSTQDPVLVFMEDIHWADDSTLDALSWLGERLQHQPVIFVCASRNSLLERRPYWGEGLDYHHRLALEPLSKRESHQLVGEILKLVEQVPPKLYELIVEGAEGNPFYVEELVKMLVEDGVVVKGEETWQVRLERLSEIKVPPTLAGVLQARLESLPEEEQQVLQQASVVGRLFWDKTVSHIQAAEGGKPEAVPGSLASLRSREMVFRREASAFTGAREYLFKHDILREVTYESVLKRLRKKYHGLVADWLILQVESRIGEYSGLIAWHLLQAGRKEEAGEYYLQAGQAALASYANVEAETYFSQALDLPLSVEQKAACLYGKGKALHLRGDRQAAVEIYRQAIELFFALGNNDRVAYLYTHLSQALTWEDNIKSWAACQEGLKCLEGAPASPGMARLLAETGRQAWFMVKPAVESLSICQKAIEMAEHFQELEAKAEASITMSMLIPDFDQAYSLLQHTEQFCEENRIWASALRACHNMSVLLSNNYRSLETILPVEMKAIEIEIFTGNMEALFYTMGNQGINLRFMGKVNKREEIQAEILQRALAPEALSKNLLENARKWDHYVRGEWDQALEFFRFRLAQARKTNLFQSITNFNIRLVDNCLELNRFRKLVDLSEAEAALQENISIQWQPNILPSRFLLVVVFARLGQLAKARNLLGEASQDMLQSYQKDDEVCQLRAREELARAEGEWEEAIHIVNELIDIYQGGSYIWLWARQLIDLGDALMGRDLPGDRDQAQQVYRQSLHMFIEMGTPGYIQVLEERLGIKEA